MASYNVNNLTRMDNFRRKKAFDALAREYEKNLPSASLVYPNIIFLYNEYLAVISREFLFSRLNDLAAKNRQTLVVTDIGYGRGGFYLNFDELGAGSSSEDYDVCIEAWS